MNSVARLPTQEGLGRERRAGQEQAGEGQGRAGFTVASSPTPPGAALLSARVRVHNLNAATTATTTATTTTSTAADTTFTTADLHGDSAACDSQPSQLHTGPVWP